MEIRESQIEDVLVSTPVLMKSILNLEDEPRLLGRQIIIPSGRLDLLYAYRTKLLLIELKVVPFQQKFVKQVLGYRHDLISYQDNGKLLHGEILPYLLYPSDSDHKGIIDTQAGITRINYNPEDILQFFYNNFEPIASFTKIKPVDFGIWNLHLMHKFLYLLLETNSVNEVQKLTNGSSKSLHNKIRFAREIRLGPVFKPQFGSFLGVNQSGSQA